MQNNTYLNQKERGLKRKYEYILSRGGKCEKCGYDHNLAALEFHHINPEEKEFQIDIRKFANANLNQLKQELDKCVILCANCHRETHHPDLSSDQLEVLLQSNKKSFNSTKYKTICPTCEQPFKNNGRVYCCDECRNKAKNYPSKAQVEFQYSILHSWEKVAQYFGVTRRIIQGIRKRE